MSLRISLLFSLASIQVACCSQAFSYPVIAVVSKIKVIEGLNTPLKEIKDGSQISKTVKFSGGKYKMDISEEEKQEFLQLMGTSQEELFK